MKAMVLCAGYGTRLGELTREIPKPMLEIKGEPMLAWILKNLKRHGFDNVMVNLHFKPEMIRDYFGDGSRFGVKLTYSHEPELLGTAGGVKNVKSFLKDETEFLVHYGDIITDQDFSVLLRAHRERNALTTVLLHQRAKSNSIASLDAENRIVGFLERPTEEARRGVESPWVNSGICICSPEILPVIPPQKSCDLPRDIFPKLIESKRLFGFPLSGFRCAIDSPERLETVRAAFAEGRLK